MAKVDSNKARKGQVSSIPAATWEELAPIASRIGDARCALEIASDAAASGDVDDCSKVAGVLDMVTRELARVEDMLDPVTMRKARESAKGATHG